MQQQSFLYVRIAFTSDWSSVEKMWYLLVNPASKFPVPRDSPKHNILLANLRPKHQQYISVKVLPKFLV